MPPGTPNTRLIRIGSGIRPSSSQRTALTTWPTSNASTSSPIPARVARSMIPRAAGGGVMKVSSPKFIDPGLDAGEVRLSGQAGGALLDRHVVGAARRDHGDQLAALADARDHILEELRAPAGRAVVLAHVQVHHGRARLRRLDALLGDLRRRVRDIGVVGAKDVSARRSDGHDHRVAVPGLGAASRRRCAGRSCHWPGSLGNVRWLSQARQRARRPGRRASPGHIRPPARRPRGRAGRSARRPRGTRRG